MFARLIAVAVTLAAAPAFAADLKVLTTGAFKPVAADIIAQHERASGDKVAVTIASSASIMAKLKAGETPDMVILTKEGIDELIAQGKVVAGSRAEIASAQAGGRESRSRRGDRPTRRRRFVVRS